MSKANVGNIPEFYMANPIGESWITKSRNNFPINRLKVNDMQQHQKGNWLITQFIDSNTKAPMQVKNNLVDFLASKGLVHTDARISNQINGYYIDLGGILSKSHNDADLLWAGNSDRLQDILEGLM